MRLNLKQRSSECIRANRNFFPSPLFICIFTWRRWSSKIGVDYFRNLIFRSAQLKISIAVCNRVNSFSWRRRQNLLRILCARGLCLVSGLAGVGSACKRCEKSQESCQLQLQNLKEYEGWEVMAMTLTSWLHKAVVDDTFNHQNCDRHTLTTIPLPKKVEEVSHAETQRASLDAASYQRRNEKCVLLNPINFVHLAHARPLRLSAN